MVKAIVRFALLGGRALFRTEILGNLDYVLLVRFPSAASSDALSAQPDLLALVRCPTQ